jgi:hypothetical protein
MIGVRHLAASVMNHSGGFGGGGEVTTRDSASGGFGGGKPKICKLSFGGFSFSRVPSSSVKVDRDFFSLLCFSVVASTIPSNSITDSL